MSPTTLALIVGLVEEAIKDTPALITEFQAIFNNPNPVPADWQALKAKVTAESYESYVPQTAITPATPSNV